MSAPWTLLSGCVLSEMKNAGDTTATAAVIDNTNTTIQKTSQKVWSSVM